MKDSSACVHSLDLQYYEPLLQAELIENQTIECYNSTAIFSYDTTCVERTSSNRNLIVSVPYCYQLSAE